MEKRQRCFDVSTSYSNEKLSSCLETQTSKTQTSDPEKLRPRARSIQPKFPEISVQNSMDRFGPTGKVSKKRVHLLRWSSFPGRTGWNFGWMDRAPLTVSKTQTSEKLIPCNSTYSRRKSNKLLFLIPLLGRRTGVLHKKETNHIKFDLFQARASRVGALPTNTKKQQFEVTYRLHKLKQIFIGCYTRPKILIASEKHAVVKLKLSVAEKKIALNNRTTNCAKILQKEVSLCYQTDNVNWNIHGHFPEC